MSVQNEFVEHYQWLASLREELRELVLRYWDETGRPRTEDPVGGLLVDLARLNAQAGYDAFKTDAINTLVRFQLVPDKYLPLAWRMFMGGAMWGCEVIRDQIRAEAANMASSRNL